MKSLFILALVAISLSLSGCAGSPIHGKGTVGAVVDPTDVAATKVTVGGEISFLKRHRADPKANGLSK